MHLTNYVLLTRSWSTENTYMLLSRFIKNIKDHNLFQPNDLLLLAVSGGLDSVVLCELCHTAGLRFEIAHANFGLRENESDEDEALVISLADKYRVPVHVRKFETKDYADKNKKSIQVSARELRYSWFSELLKNGPKYVLTAHHSDDNVETVMMNFFRGTGIHGLRGIPVKNDRIVRPLLPFTKKDLICFAQEKQLRWREDPSNALDKYSRNFFRNTLIPSISKIFPAAEKNIAENIRRFSDIEKLYEHAIGIYKKQLIEKRGNEIHIPVLKLLKSEPVNTIVYEIIRDYQFTPQQVRDVVHLLTAEQGKFVQSDTYRIFRNRNWLIISPNETEKGGNILIEKGTSLVQYPEGKIEIKVKANTDLSSSTEIAQLDSRQVDFPLILRRWKSGDYFYPLGMKKEKDIPISY